MASVSREKMELPTSKPVGGHSTFKNGYPLAGSYRFGQIQPHFVQEVVPDDDIELSTSYKLDSYTLAQPLMQDMFITHGYYFIPYPALLPFNYEKLITNPNIGEDVDAQQVGLSYDFNNLSKFFASFKNGISVFLNADVPNYDRCFELILKYVLSFDMIFGQGGLPSTLGYKFLTPDQAKLIESAYQFILSKAEENNITFDFGDRPVGSFHELVELCRDDFDFQVQVVSSSSNVPEFISALVASDGSFKFSFPIFPSSSKLINMSRILAYQIACAHFFTNDKVDYIYSAELYRQNVYSVLQNSYLVLFGDKGSDHFSLNGESYQYDYLSAWRFDFYTYQFLNTETSIRYLNYDLQYLRLLFGFNYSLRHVDYFTGSRTRPLAVGDVGVRVNDGVVNVVENIQTTWFAKFLNQVNRTGRRINNYIKGLFPGAAISQDWHDPIWLGDTTDKIGSSEVDNTGEAQQTNKNSITSTLNSNAAKYGFRYQNTQYYGVIIGVTYFDLERFYPEVTERPIYHVDRFDMFNPFLQFNGDQEVYIDELYSVHDADQVFGYQSRYLEYKQRVPQAFGAFVTDPVLSKSIFIADIEKDNVRDREDQRISPSYIRSHPLEFDRFYLSLTGLSLSEYFHFQIIHWNRVKSVRPMVFNPQLG